MNLRRLVPAVLIALLLRGVAPAIAAALPPAFDPARHMAVAEVRPGMKGYGLTVFSGEKIERFGVEVIDILRNFNPQGDVILIHCDGDFLKHTGPIAGMSGSPIYLYDDTGKPRMIGAFAYGWPLQKDPIAGVQPIEYMLALPTGKPPAPATRPAPATDAAPSTQAAPHAATPNATAIDGAEPVVAAPNFASTDAAPNTAAPAAPRSIGPARWNLADIAPLPGSPVAPAGYPFASFDTDRPNPLLSARQDRDPSRLRRLATPIMVGGLSPSALRQLTGVLERFDMTPLQAGAGAGVGAASAPSTRPADDHPIAFAPGSVLAVPLMTGDVDLTAIGTCTEVLGDKVYGFGHPFFNEGPVAWPLATGRIHTVIANLVSSFKLGAIDRVTGTLRTDRMVGIAGQIGEKPPTLPIDLKLIYSDGSLQRSYHFDAALHPTFTPLLVGFALQSTATSARELPLHHTLDYDVNVTFANGKVLHIVNTAVNANVGQLFLDIGTPIMTMAENPFERVMPAKVVGTLTVTPEARDATILSVHIPRLKYRPGDLLKGYVSYRPFQGDEAILPIAMTLPRDLGEGDYQLIVGDWQRYMQDQLAAEPFRFSAESADGIFQVLTEVSGIRHNALYLRLLRKPDGVAIGRAAMPHLPSSRREILLSAGRSNTTAFVSSQVTILPTDRVMSGSAEFVLTIDKDAKVEVAGKLPKPDEPKPHAPAAEPSKPANPPANAPAPGNQPGGPGKEG